MATPTPGPPAGFELPGGVSDLDVRYYLGLLFRARLLILASVLVAVGVGLVTGMLQTPEYQAGAMLQLEPPTPAFMGVGEAGALVGGGNYWQNADFYNTQFKVLRSRGIAETVVARLKLGEGALKGAPDASSAFIEHVAVNPIPESRLVVVTVTHRDPREAALWANTLANVYMEYMVASRVESAQRAYDWVQERLTTTQKNMQLAKERLLKSYEQQDLFVPEGTVSAVSTSIARLTGDFIDAQARRIALEAAFKQVDELRRRNLPIENVPQIAGDDYIRGGNNQIADLNVQLAKARETYREQHPSVQALLLQIETIKKNKAQRANAAVEGMKAEYAQFQKRETELRAAIDKQKSSAATLGMKATQLDTLKKEAESASSLYDVLLQKLNETDIAASVRNNNVVLVERAVPPSEPVYPNKKRLAAIAGLVGLFLGVGLVIGRDLLHNTIKNPEEIERYLHVDLLTTVPRYDEANVHLVTEAYQNLRTAMLFARKEDTGQVVLVTGTAPQEGKTTTLVNLAQLIATSGETALAIDFDLRRATLHTRLGLPREPGVTDFFVSHLDLDALIQTTRTPNLFALTAGPIPPNPPALLARRQMDSFFDHMRRHYDWVLVDSPPLASVTDALLIARHADMAIFVVEHNKVDKRLVKRQVNALRKATPNLLGAVLNAVDAKAKGYYYYYYHHAYGETETKGARKADATDDRSVPSHKA